MQKDKCNGPKLNKMGLKYFKRNGFMDWFCGSTVSYNA